MTTTAERYKSSAFSATERLVILILGDRKMTLAQLAARYIFKTDSSPYDPTSIVAAAVRRINKKCEYYKLTWFINGQGLGRGGRTVWIDDQ